MHSTTPSSSPPDTPHPTNSIPKTQYTKDYIFWWLTILTTYVWVLGAVIGMVKFDEDSGSCGYANAKFGFVYLTLFTIHAFLQPVFLPDEVLFRITFMTFASFLVCTVLALLPGVVALTEFILPTSQSKFLAFMFIITMWMRLILKRHWLWGPGCWIFKDF